MAPKKKPGLAKRLQFKIKTLGCEVLDGSLNEQMTKYVLLEKEYMREKPKSTKIYNKMQIAKGRWKQIMRCYLRRIKSEIDEEALELDFDQKLRAQRRKILNAHKGKLKF